VKLIGLNISNYTSNKMKSLNIVSEDICISLINEIFSN